MKDLFVRCLRALYAHKLKAIKTHVEDVYGTAEVEQRDHGVAEGEGLRSPLYTYKLRAMRRYADGLCAGWKRAEGRKN